MRIISSQDLIESYMSDINEAAVRVPRKVRGARATQSELQYARTRYNSTRKEEFELWVNSLVNEGYDLSEYTWDDVYEIYETYSDYLTVQSFLIGEGYADSIQESDYMIENMDKDLIEEILENAYYDAEQIGRKLGKRQYEGKVSRNGNKLSRRAIQMVRNASPEDRKDVKRGLKTGFLLGADGPGI